jgi:hypothetical protein
MVKVDFYYGSHGRHTGGQQLPHSSHHAALCVFFPTQAHWHGASSFFVTHFPASHASTRCHNSCFRTPQPLVPNLRRNAPKRRAVSDFVPKSCDTLADRRVFIGGQFQIVQPSPPTAHDRHAITTGRQWAWAMCIGDKNKLDTCQSCVNMVRH